MRDRRPVTRDRTGLAISMACCAAGVFAALGVAAPAVSAAAEPRASDSRSRSVTVTSRLQTRGSIPIARSFLGFSMEYGGLFARTGFPGIGMNPVFTGLVRNITENGSGPPVLRIGGGLSDQSWWNPGRLPRPMGVTVDLAPLHAETLAQVHGQTRMPMILGLNFALRDPSKAAEVVREFTNRLPAGSIRSFEIGNEPDIYPRRPMGRNPDGSQAYARAPGYGPPQYLRELRPFIETMRSLDPRPPLAGPVATCDAEWCPALGAILRRYGRDLSEVTYHWYPLHACERRAGSRDFPTIRQMLGPEGFTRIPAFRQAANVAKRHGLTLRVTESNSVACNGAAGVSDVFASALWSVDWLFLHAAAGSTGVDMHTGGNIYPPFVTRRINDQWVGIAKPLYYGMLLFSEATAGRAKLLPHTTLGTRVSRAANVRVWATMTRRRTARVVVVNKDTRRNAVARIEVPGARRRGVVVRLRSRSLRSRTATLAGQRVLTPTTDGRLVGRRSARRVRPRRGVYRFTVPRGSAAMLTVHRVPRRGR